MDIDPLLLLPPFTNPNLTSHPNQQSPNLLNLSKNNQTTSTLQTHCHLILLPTAIQPGPTHVQPPAGTTPAGESVITLRLITMEAKCYKASCELEVTMYVSPYLLLPCLHSQVLLGENTRHLSRKSGSMWLQHYPLTTGESFTQSRRSSRPNPNLRPQDICSTVITSQIYHWALTWF